MEGERWGRTAVDKEEHVASHFYKFCSLLPSAKRNEPGNNASSSVVVLVTVSLFKAPTTSHA